MERSTILKVRAACDLKKLRLSGLEGFVLAQLDGKLTIEEVGEITGLDLDEMMRVANILLLSEAATIVAAPMKRGGITEDRSPRRIDPRVEVRTTIHPRSSTKKSIVPSANKKQARSIIPDPRMEKVTIAPKPELKQQQPLQQLPPRNKSRKSLRMQRMQRPIIPRNSTPPRTATPPPTFKKPSAAPKEAPARKASLEEEVCELDAATIAKIDALFNLIDRVDHYTFFELERNAEKKTIKRAYFAYVAKFHPDRFFGKKLGAQRKRIERVFEYATAAHDVMVDPAQRSLYDARLPKVSSSKAPPPSKATSAPPKRKTVPPEPVAAPAAPARKMPSARKMSKAAMRAASRQMQAAAPPASSPAAATKKPSSATRMKHLRNAMMEVKLQGRIDALLEAAEAALKADKVVEAANNFRLALEHRDDPAIRMKFEEVDRFARSVRLEKHMAVARAAERNQQWADAATYLKRAHEVQPSADIAERAAVALRLSGGDLEEAAELAEEAVKREPKNARYRITLGETYLMMNQLEIAEEEAELAVQLAPKDERAKALITAIAKKKKAAK